MTEMGGLRSLPVVNDPNELILYRSRNQSSKSLVLDVLSSDVSTSFGNLIRPTLYHRAQTESSCPLDQIVKEVINTSSSCPLRYGPPEFFQDGVFLAVTDPDET